MSISNNAPCDWQWLPAAAPQPNSLTKMEFFSSHHTLKTLYTCTLTFSSSTERHSTIGFVSFYFGSCSRLPRAELTAACPPSYGLMSFPSFPTMACYFLPLQWSFWPGSDWCRAWAQNHYWAKLRLPKRILPHPIYGYRSAGDPFDGNPGNSLHPSPALVFPWFSGSPLSLRGSSLLLAACWKCKFRKWIDHLGLTQLKSPAKCSIFKPVSDFFKIWFWCLGFLKISFVLLENSHSM